MVLTPGTPKATDGEDPREEEDKKEGTDGEKKKEGEKGGANKEKKEKKEGKKEGKGDSSASEKESNAKTDATEEKNQPDAFERLRDIDTSDIPQKELREIQVDTTKKINRIMQNHGVMIYGNSNFNLPTHDVTQLRSDINYTNFLKAIDALLIEEARGNVRTKIFEILEGGTKKIEHVREETKREEQKKKEEEQKKKEEEEKKKQEENQKDVDKEEGATKEEKKPGFWARLLAKKSWDERWKRKIEKAKKNGETNWEKVYKTGNLATNGMYWLLGLRHNESLNILSRNFWLWNIFSKR